MILSTLILAFILGALWRRWWGGWLGGRRWWRVVGALPLTLPAFLAFPWWVAIPVAAGGIYFFVPGHVVETPWRRYGPFGVAYWAALRWWPPHWTFGKGLVDGPIAVGELGLGGLFWGFYAGVCLSWASMMS